MSLNCSEVNLILDELKLNGFFIQKIIQPSYSTLVLNLYKTESLTLFFSLFQGECRFHKTKQKFAKPKKPLRFMELLKSRILGCKIENAEQINADRIVKFTLSNSEEKMFLYFKLWSGASNILLTDENNIIIDSFYRRPKKNEITGGIFVLPEKKTDEEVKQSLSKFTVRKFNTKSNKLQEFNQLIESEYADNKVKLSKDDVLKQIENFYAEKFDKLNSNLRKMKKKLKSLSNAEKFKHYGDLLFSNLHLLKKGMTSIEIEDFENNQKIKLELNPLKSPTDNASEYYQKYKKMISGTQTLTDDIKSIESKIKSLNNNLKTLQSEEDLKELKKTLNKLNRFENTVQLKSKTGKNFTGLKFNINGWQIFVGRTATENDELLRHYVKGSDLWLHARDYAGGYVFIKAHNKKTIPLPVLLSAGNLAVFYSKARRAGEADLYYTHVKHLRRAKGAKKGTVLPQQEKNLFIKLDENILKKNEECRII